MLVLTIKKGERLIIGDPKGDPDRLIDVWSFESDARLSIDAPDDVEVNREVIFNRKRAEGTEDSENAA